MRNAINNTQSKSKKRAKDSTGNKPETQYQALLNQLFTFFKKQFDIQNKSTEELFTKLNIKLDKLDKLDNLPKNIEAQTPTGNLSSREFLNEFLKQFKPEYLTQLHTDFLNLNRQLTEYYSTINTQQQLDLSPITNYLQEIQTSVNNSLNVENQLQELNTGLEELKTILSENNQERNNK